MDVLIITLAASLVLVLLGVLFLANRVHSGDLEHGDRLSLLPLDEDLPPSSPPPPSPDGEAGKPRGDTVEHARGNG